MKKILLIPTTFVAAITPIIATTSCNNPDTPTPDPVVTKYAFEFTGNYCKINNQSHFVEQIEEGTKVEYGILPDPGYKLSATQDLPQGVTLTGGLLTIARMDKAYTVTINAEPIERSLVISGLEASYEGIVRVANHTNAISVTLSEDGKEKDVTDLVTFDPAETAPMVGDKENMWFTGPDTLDCKPQGYKCSFTANYLDIISSQTYTTTLTINPGEAKIVCDGLVNQHTYEIPKLTPGGIPVTCGYCDEESAHGVNVTSEVVVTIEASVSIDEQVYWDPTFGIRGNELSCPEYGISFECKYNPGEGSDVVSTIHFVLECI